MDRSYLYGDGLFETLRVENGRVFFLARHLRRFERSASALGYPDEQIRAGLKAIEEVDARMDGLHRVTVSRDDPAAPFGGEGGITVTHRPLPQASRPSLVTLAGWYWPGDPLGNHKATSYLRSIEARRIASAQGYDDALMVSEGGLVGETSTSNVFAVIGGEVVTAPAMGLLPGVCREALIEDASDSGIEISVRELRRDELDSATEIICTSAGLLAVAARSLDGRELAAGVAPRIRQLLAERSV